MKILFSVLLLLAAAGAATWTAPPQAAASQPAGKSLYQRLGGYDAIAAITDDMIPRFVGDPQLKPFFRGLNAEHQRLVRQHLVDFLCQATGGPCYYTGRDMKTAHTGLNITDEQWQAAMKEVAASLDNFKVPDREKSEVLAAVGGLKADIVGR